MMCRTEALAFSNAAHPHRTSISRRHRPAIIDRKAHRMRDGP